MPVVAYYLGRPARIWITAMSGSARATPANPAATPAARDPRRPRGEGRWRRPVHPQPQSVSTTPGGLGQQLVHPCQPRTASPIDFRSTLTRKHVRTSPIPEHDQASSTAERQPDDYDPG